MENPSPELPPFVRFLPERLEPTDLSIRNRAGERPTLRFFVSMHGRMFRVKEFFMDWFYPGFPKNLMASFQKTYSDVVSEPSRGGILFMGNDYRGLSSCSINLMGTSIEVESSSPAHALHFRKLMDDLVPVDDDVARIRQLGYSRRSYLAGGGAGNWFEDRRVSSVKWMDLDHNALKPLQENLHAAAAGIGLAGDRIEQAIIVLESPDLRKSAWIDIVMEGAEIAHGLYRFRKEPGIFDHFEFSQEQLMMRKGTGPALARVRAGDFIATMSFFPGENFPDSSKIRESAIHLQSEMDHLMRVLTEIEYPP